MSRAARSPSREVSAAASCRPSQYSATARSSSARGRSQTSPHAGQCHRPVGEPVRRAVLGHQQGGHGRAGQGGRREVRPGEPVAENDRPAQRRPGRLVVAPQGRRHTGELCCEQFRPGWRPGPAQCPRPSRHVGVPVLVTGEADRLAGPQQRRQGQVRGGAGARVGGSEQGGQRDRGPAAAQFHLAA
ncbi:hypothetical protein [Micromonospora echinospora]|uniref:hypothetical protein n=1 Tax=Micromonospora echinospora TaxID=1877 RepID=UPI003A840DA6